MRAGGLDRRVTLQRKTIVQDEYGEEEEVWVDLATVFAEVRQQGGKEFLAAEQVQASKRVVFYIRHYPSLTVLDRVAYEGTLHNINEVREIARRDGTELHTVAAA